MNRIKALIWDKIIVKHFQDEIDLSNIQYVGFLDDILRVNISDLEDEIEKLEAEHIELADGICSNIEDVRFRLGVINK